MSTVVKPHTFQNGQTADGTEVNSNFDTLYNDYNGNITDVNIAASGITTYGKVQGSAIANLTNIAASAGVLPAANLPAMSYVKNDGTVNPTNLLSNGDFESWSAGASAAPDGWVAELTPTIARDTGDVGYGSYSCKITGAGAALEGIKYTTPTLKPSTKYTLSVRVKATAGDTASIITTGATTNLALESTATTFTLVTGTFTTDGSGTAVVIKLLAKADTDIVWFDGAMLVEGESAFAFSPKPWSNVNGFGAPVAKSIGTIYQAETHGIVVCRNGSDTITSQILVTSDSTNPPTVVLAQGASPGASSGGCTCVIRKYDYYKATASGGSSYQFMYFIPFGA